MWPQELNSVGAGPSVPYTNQNGLQYEQKSSHTVMSIFDLRDVRLLYKYTVSVELVVIMLLQCLTIMAVRVCKVPCFLCLCPSQVPPPLKLIRILLGP